MFTLKVLNDLKPRPKRTGQDGHKADNKLKNRDPNIIPGEIL